jgi:hypothetical protein
MEGFGEVGGKFFAGSYSEGGEERVREVLVLGGGGELVVALSMAEEVNAGGHFSRVFFFWDRQVDASRYCCLEVVNKYVGFE